LNPPNEAKSDVKAAVKKTSPVAVPKKGAPQKKAHPGKSAPKTPTDWRNLSEDDLLGMRIRDLGLRIEGSPLEPRIQRFYDELTEKGLVFQPPCYLADEWLTPDGMPIIGIPFFLAHPKLTALEKKMMLEAEGEKESWCM
jgi:hypothetical protein